MTSFQPSRRSFLRTTALTLPAVWMGLGTRMYGQDDLIPPMVLQARAAAAKAEIKTKSLRGNVSVLMGSGGNIAVLPGKEGFLMVDAGYLSSQPQITAALVPLGAGKVTTLVNTHWHFDHTDGNLWVHDQGAVITAHTNTKKHLTERTEMKAFQVTFPPAPMGAAPTEVFDDARTLKMNKATIEMTHYAPAHTDSDISVHFVEANVLHCGDTLFSEGYPFIDYSTGGSIDGMIAATKKNIAMTDKSTQVIPGHGEVVDQAGLRAVLDMLQGSRAAVAALKQQGKSLQETVAAAPTAAYDAKWGKGFMNGPTFTALVYQGV